MTDARTGYSVQPVEPDKFSTHRVCAIRHDFDRHPAMQLPALAALAERLMPTRQCRFIKPGTGKASAFDHSDASHDGKSIREVFDHIQETGSWVALYNVQTDPEYRAFVNEVADCVRPMVEREQPRMTEVGGFIFISAPPSITPFHIDRENNFWLQIRGRKTMHVWDPTDREAVPQDVVDDFVVHGDLTRVHYTTQLDQRCHRFDTGPGDGVYFPSTSPHMTQTDTSWVQPGEGVSISMGVVFYTDVTQRGAYVHAFNRIGRRVGITPSSAATPDGQTAWRYWLGRGIVGLHKMTRGWTPPRGF